MDNTKISVNNIAVQDKRTASVPLGVEYEQLVKKLRENAENKNKVIDLRNKNEFSLDNIKKDTSKKTVVLQPGMLIDQETNLFPAYPQNNVPYSQGLPWSDF